MDETYSEHEQVAVVEAEDEDKDEENGIRWCVEERKFSSGGSQFILGAKGNLADGRG